MGTPFLSCLLPQHRIFFNLDPPTKHPGMSRSHETGPQFWLDCATLGMSLWPHLRKNVLAHHPPFNELRTV